MWDLRNLWPKESGFGRWYQKGISSKNEPVWKSWGKSGIFGWISKYAHKERGGEAEAWKAVGDVLRACMYSQHGRNILMSCWGGRGGEFILWWRSVWLSEANPAFQPCLLPPGLWVCSGASVRSLHSPALRSPWAADPVLHLPAAPFLLPLGQHSWGFWSTRRGVRALCLTLLQGILKKV